ncbi:hypothetical protein NFI96_005962 [Prochilodus magdalenae]|nr:hypothetical protein NFI96_005962 [Prochilodus magdalenae]
MLTPAAVVWRISVGPGPGDAAACLEPPVYESGALKFYRRTPGDKVLLKPVCGGTCRYGYQAPPVEPVTGRGRAFPGSCFGVRYADEMVGVVLWCCIKGSCSLRPLTPSCGTARPLDPGIHHPEPRSSPPAQQIPSTGSPQGPREDLYPTVTVTPLTVQDTGGAGSCSSHPPPEPRMASINNQPITEIQISLNKDQEDKLERAGFTRVPGDLNSGTAGPVELLWYKRGHSRAVTRIQFSFREEMNEGLTASGFTKINKNINTGTAGDAIFLWYLSCTTQFDSPVLDLKVTTKVEEEPELFLTGWERMGLDLNRNAGGHPVYVWVLRDTTTYISSITASLDCSGDRELFQHGYIRVDEDTNRGAFPAGAAVFPWFRQSKVQGDGITEIEVSLNKDQEVALEARGFTKVNKDLNEGANGDPVYLWYMHSQAPPIQFLTVLVGEVARSTYKKAGVCTLVEKNLNSGNNGVPLYIAYKHYRGPPPGPAPGAHPQDPPLGPTTGTHHRGPPPGPTPRTHHRGPPPGPIPRAHPPGPPPGPTPGAHPRDPPPGPTPGTHPWGPPPGPTPGTHPRGPPPGPTPGTHPRDPPPGLTHHSADLRGFTSDSHCRLRIHLRPPLQTQDSPQTPTADSGFTSDSHCRDSGFTSDSHCRDSGFTSDSHCRLRIHLRIHLRLRPLQTQDSPQTPTDSHLRLPLQTQDSPQTPLRLPLQRLRTPTPQTPTAETEDSPQRLPLQRLRIHLTPGFTSDETPTAETPTQTQDSPQTPLQTQDSHCRETPRLRIHLRIHLRPPLQTQDSPQTPTADSGFTSDSHCRLRTADSGFTSDSHWIQGFTSDLQRLRFTSDSGFTSDSHCRLRIHLRLPLQRLRIHLRLPLQRLRIHLRLPLQRLRIHLRLPLQTQDSPQTPTAETQDSPQTPTAETQDSPQTPTADSGFTSDSHCRLRIHLRLPLQRLRIHLRLPLQTQDSPQTPTADSGFTSDSHCRLRIHLRLPLQRLRIHLRLPLQTQDSPQTPTAETQDSPQTPTAPQTPLQDSPQTPTADSDSPQTPTADSGFNAERLRLPLQTEDSPQTPTAETQDSPQTPTAETQDSPQTPTAD